MPVRIGAFPRGDRHKAARLVKFFIDRQALGPSGTNRRVVGHRDHVEIEKVAGIGVRCARLPVAIDRKPRVKVDAAEVVAALADRLRRTALRF